LGVVIAALGLWLGRRGHNVRARDVQGSVVAGEVKGSVSITNTGPHAAPSKDRERGQGDRIAWAIAIVGVLIAAAQLAHDIFGQAR
jgi:hypothetical protein